MKALFLIFHSFYAANGISKKIHYQVDALKACGIDTELCYVHEENGYKQRRVDDKIICDYGNGIKGKILKRIEYGSISNYAINNHIDMIYIRSAHNANPLTIHMVKQMYKAGIQNILEIPTFPYDQEYDSFRKKLELFPDKLFRRRMMKYITKIVTFSEEKKIFGIPTIQISNGIDFNHIPQKQRIGDISKELHLIGVAEIHYWHGFDRVIKGMVNYYRQHPDYKVYFHIVGDFFGERERNEIIPLIKQYQLEKYILLHGRQQGEELDHLFEQTDMGIGSLGRHRSGIHSIKTLKNREYAARGIPFIYSEFDSDFESMPYIMKAAADESPIDIQQLITFRKETTLAPMKIRNSIRHLSWENQMQKVINSLDITK